MSRKIAIVGSSAGNWTLEERKIAYKEIKKLLNYWVFELGYEHYLGKRENNSPFAAPPLMSHKIGLQQVTLISGGCPKGGVDLWAEAVAQTMGITTWNIKEPVARQWNDRKVTQTNGEIRVDKGYKTRNMEIAEICDILYCLIPQENMWSGARWTMNYAEKLGKEVHLVVCSTEK